MMIRRPLARRWRIVLGCSSVLLLILLYTLFAHVKHREKQREQFQALGQRLETIRQRQRKAQSEMEALPAEASDQRQRWQDDLRSLSQQLRELEAKREQAGNFDLPDANDQSIPLWSSLYHNGLLRAITPQGLRKDEIWLWEDSLATFSRLVSGLVVGVMLSVALGLCMGCFTEAEAFFLPPLSFLAKIPPTAMLAVFFVLVGTTYKMYVTMIAFGMLPTLAQSVYQAAKKDVPDELVYKAYTLGAHHSELIWNVIFKQILPRVLDAVRLTIGPAMVLLVAAEWMVAGEGFGYRLRLFYQRTDMTVVYVYLIILGLAGLLADYALIWTRRKLCPWFGD